MTDEINILAEDKPKTIKLADGKEYTLPPIDMTTLANIEKTMGIGGRKVATQLESEPLQTMQLFIYALLKEISPDITREQAGRLVTIKEMPQFSEAISIIMAISS